MTQLELLVDAISHMEGFGRPGTVPTRLNNPGDLMFAHQHNAIPHVIHGSDGKDRTYAEFPTVQDGLNALIVQIKLDALGRSKTLAQFISIYAPASDGNNPAGYLAFVMQKMGVTDPNRLLKEILAGCI